MPMQGKIHIAPMMGWTNQHFRYFMRLLYPKVVLYSEMITTGAILHGGAERMLSRDADDGEVILQLGGSDPANLAKCARLAQQYGYSGVNLNVGCPSARVQAGNIGACLFKDPALVGECVSAMQDAVDIDVTVKCRIGVDEMDSFEHLMHFLTTIQLSGCRQVQIHARKAWLKGLNPKQNRSVPMLNYDRAYDAAKACPAMTVVLNGGINTVEVASAALMRFSGVMIGRAAYQRPLFIRELATKIDPHCEYSSVVEVVDRYIEHVVCMQSKGHRLSVLLKPLQNVLHACPYAKSWRTLLSDCGSGTASLSALSTHMVHICYVD